jgi:hypothetical protein
VTAYNGMYRCEGGQMAPGERCPCCDKAKCRYCDRFFKLYPNGKVVMHKRPSRRRVGGGRRAGPGGKL